MRMAELVAMAVIASRWPSPFFDILKLVKSVK
jgi:hypothetical protein